MPAQIKLYKADSLDEVITPSRARPKIPSFQVDEEVSDGEDRRTPEKRRKKSFQGRREQDEEWRESGSSANTHRAATREQEIIAIDSSDDESQGEEARGKPPQPAMLSESRPIPKKGASARHRRQETASNSSASNSPPAKTKTRREPPTDKLDMDVIRIMVGNKSYSNGCRMYFRLGEEHPGSIVLECNPNNQAGACNEIIEVALDESVVDLKYYLTDELEAENCQLANLSLGDQDQEPRKGKVEDDYVPFLAMRVKPNDTNRLGKFERSYLGTPDKEVSPADNSRNYIVVELRSNNNFLRLRNQCRGEHDHTNPVLEKLLESPSLSKEDSRNYTRWLFKCIENEKKERLQSSSQDSASITQESSPVTRRTTRSGALRRPLRPTTLLVYPFDSDETSIENAARGLLEASGQTDRDDASSVPGADDTDHSSSADHPVSNGRTHYLTIQSADFDRLRPYEFLNDTLIDFWMRWIWRRERHCISQSAVHFFTSHFYTTLFEDGISAVSSWTKKKSINVFSKSLVFLPINESLHWSLCVLVNPGSIMNTYRDKDHHQSDQAPEEDYLASKVPCILFLDSLKAHRKNRVAKAVNNWLNFEWKRLELERTPADQRENRPAPDPRDQPFDNRRMKVYAPKIPYQDNSWDCGVFVCRYAYALYQQRHVPFTYADVKTLRTEEDSGQFQPFKERITDGSQFQFGMDDIRRLRKEMGMLIENLSTLYLRPQEKERTAKSPD